jgi:ribosome-associated translation inhibitor RaiA
MPIPIQITYRGLPSSEAIEQNVHKRAARLERFRPGITACHVTIEVPHHHHQRGNHYRVQVELGLPGGPLVVTRGNADNQAYEDVYLVIRDAFSAALRRLEERRGRPLTQRRVREAAPIEEARRSS